MIAVILQEADHDRVIAALSSGEQATIGAPIMFETELVMCARAGPPGREQVRRFVDEFGIGEVAFDGRHRSAASAAYLRFGKGRHRARLNMGDCMTYAIAKLADEPLLCLGDDFAQTDLQLVLPAG